MTDPAVDAARSAAVILTPDFGPSLSNEVEAALLVREESQRPARHTDPTSLASLIVSVATLAWTIYNDQRSRNNRPESDVIARQIRITLREQDVPLPAGTERITEIVATEITRLANATNTISGGTFTGPVLQARDFDVTLRLPQEPADSELQLPSLRDRQGDGRRVSSPNHRRWLQPALNAAHMGWRTLIRAVMPMDALDVLRGSRSDLQIRALQVVEAELDHAYTALGPPPGVEGQTR